MKVCVFEWISGGGCKFDRISMTDPDPNSISLRMQGQGMLTAVVEDFSNAGHEVTWLRDSSLEIDGEVSGTSIEIDDGTELRQVLLNVANSCDAILLVAPETGGRLLTVHDWLIDSQDRVISPDREFIELTTDKEATCIRLSQRGVLVPKGSCLSAFKKFDPLHNLKYPLVLKPRDGAGSEGIRLIRSAIELASGDFDSGLRIEEYVPGLAASVSALCADEEFQLLPATQQIFDAEPFGHYVGAKHPLPAQLADRAADLAAKTIRALPPTKGYIGIDMVLSTSSRDQDVVIEINPRLTMSYLTLRQICGFNIANRMLNGLGAGGKACSVYGDDPTPIP